MEKQTAMIREMAQSKVDGCGVDWVKLGKYDMSSQTRHFISSLSLHLSCMYVAPIPRF